MLDLAHPGIDFMRLARGLGLQAERAETAEEFCRELDHSLRTPGPSVIEAVIPGLL